MTDGFDLQCCIEQEQLEVHLSEPGKQQRTERIRLMLHTHPSTTERTDPLEDDAHVVAAARRCRAAVLVTENINHFLKTVLSPVGIEARTTDDFIADTIDLDPLLAVEALARMRARFQNPQLTPDALLLRYESQGFIYTADLLKTVCSGEIVAQGSASVTP